MSAEKTEKGLKTQNEFFTDAQRDFNGAFEDALLLERFDAAQTQLDELKKKNGETAAYFYRVGRLREKQGQKKEAYEHFRRLFFEWPVFMHDKYDYERFRQDVIQDNLNKCRAQWNQLIAKTSRFIEENPDAHDRDNTAPYAKAFWHSHREDLEEMARSYIAILDFEPNETAAIQALVQIYTELGDVEHQSFFQNRLTEARKYWRDLTETRSQATCAAAKKHEESAHYDAVIEVVNLGLETDPLHPDLLLAKAEALQKLKHLKEGQACVLAVLKNNPNNSRAQRLKKALEAQIFDQNLKEGLDLLSKAELEKPGSPGQIAKVESALSRFLDAIAFDGNNLTALAGVYRCHIRSAEPLKAQKTMERIRQIDSTFDVYSIFRDKADKEEKDELCFVATRVFGAEHPETVFLRGWRDNCLRHYWPGRVFISLYRRVGPALAKLPPGSDVLRLSRVAIHLLTGLLRTLFTFFQRPGPV
ncbi:MAG TPA: hypothetical protein PLK58_02550 [Candidatus Rifleibacterium sp.]|nr:hypothetical protein [Candidatus Rifleibacterium sp.]